MRQISEKTATLSFAQLSSLRELFATIIPAELYILLALIVTFYLTVWSINKQTEWTPPQNSKHIFATLFLLLVLPPLFLFGISLSLQSALYVERYYSQRVFAIGLIGGVLVTRLSSLPRQQIITSLYIFLMIFAHYFYRLEARSNEGWRSVSRSITQPALKDCPVLLFSGFIESQSIAWIFDRNISEFIRAPLGYYNVGMNAVLIPYSFDSDDGRRYYESHVHGIISQAYCVQIVYRNAVLYVGGRTLEPSPLYLAAQLRNNGFHATTTTSHGLVEHAVYSK